jgi:hypothetical protein
VWGDDDDDDDGQQDLNLKMLTFGFVIGLSWEGLTRKSTVKHFLIRIK